MDCILSSLEDCAKLKIADAKLHVPIVPLSTKDNVNLKKQLSNEFKRSVYWKNYQTIPEKVINQETNIFELLSASFQGVKRLFVLAYTFATNAANNEAGIKDNKKCFIFFPEERLKIITYWIMEETIYDQPINNEVRKYQQDKTIIIQQGDC